MGNISIWQLLIVLLIVVLVFGTRRLRGLGTDLGGALSSFRKAVSDADEDPKLTDEAGKTGDPVQDARDRVDS
ncbi:MAG: twin-arginine translocase TatA/TatE family subunit [Gammaproteobacteria bacterium]|nr:twin-arginine translocase TatA/TatE family subunit [Gammaproteobacteria bacterium]